VNDRAKVKEALLRLEFLGGDMRSRPSDYSLDPIKIRNAGMLIECVAKMIKQYLESNKISETERKTFDKLVVRLEAMR